MEANEIMTGDYFKIAQTGKIIKIVAVDEPSGSVDYFDGDAGGVLTIGVEKIEPIPPTAEILEKNGFKEIKWDELGEESSEGKPSNIFRCELETKCLMIKIEVGIYAPNFVLIYAPNDCGGETEISNICKIDGSDIMLHELQNIFKGCHIDKKIILTN